MLRRRFGDFVDQCRENPILMGSVVLLVLLYGTAVFAGFLAPYHYAEADRTKSYHPPTPIQFTDDDGLAWPYVREYEMHFNEHQERVYRAVPGERHPLVLFVEGQDYRPLQFFEDYQPEFSLHLFGVEGGQVFLLGADAQGRDLFSRILYGGQVSLTIGVVGVSIALIIGLIVGGFSGYYGGWLDTIIQRLIELIMIIPGFFLLLALRAAFPPGMDSISVFFLIVIVMSFIGWASLARVIRGMALSIREQEYVDAARASGVPGPWIIAHHIIPNTASYFVVYATISIPGYILMESALSLLGLGIQDPHASWGNLLQDAMSVTQMQLSPWILIPGLFIFLAVMAYNVIGDALRDVLDPEQEVNPTL